MTGKRGQKLRGSVPPAAAMVRAERPAAKPVYALLVWEASYSGKGPYCLVLEELEMPSDLPEDEGLVVPHQSAVYVFRNQAGGITIREEQADGDASFVSFKDEYAEAIIDAIRKVARHRQR